MITTEHEKILKDDVQRFKRETVKLNRLLDVVGALVHETTTGMITDRTAITRITELVLNKR